MSILKDLQLELTSTQKFHGDTNRKGKQTRFFSVGELSLVGTFPRLYRFENRI